MEPQTKKPRNGPPIVDRFIGIDDRACPGQPPNERYGKAYNMPYTELDEKQRAAARDVLQIFDDHIKIAWAPPAVDGSDKKKFAVARIHLQERDSHHATLVCLIIIMASNDELQLAE